MDNRVIVVTGLTPDITNDKLAELFKQVGKVEKSALVIGSDQKATGKAYVVYHSMDSAQAALQTHGDSNVNVRLMSPSDSAEFHSLFLEESTRCLMEAFAALTPDQQAKIFAQLTLVQPKSAETLLDSGCVTDKEDQLQSQPHLSGPAGSATVTPEALLLMEPQLPYFSGAGKDGTFGRWKYEVQCLIEDGTYSPPTVISAVRRSLRSPAADVLSWLGVKATTGDILSKLTSIYGSVQSGDTLLEQFYSKPQLKGESCAQWGCRLEDLIYQAAGKEAVARSAVPQHLKRRFWSGLKDRHIKDMLRHCVDAMTFEELLNEARTLEEEYKPDYVNGKSEALLHQVAESDTMLDRLCKQIEKLESQLKQLQQQMKPKVKKQTSKSGAHDKPKDTKGGRCEQEGHVTFGSRKDTAAGVTCNRCKQVGDISKSCKNHCSTLNSKVTSPKGQEEVSSNTSPKCELLGPANEAEVMIGGLMCAALIDTGSMITSVSTNYFKEHLEDIYPLQPLDSLMVEGAGGENLPYLGYIDAALMVPDCMMEELGVPILVIKDTSYNSRVPVVVGTNVIKVLKEESISPQNDVWRMAIESMQVNQAVIPAMPVYTCQQIVVNPDSSIVVSARVSPSKEFMSGIVQPVDSLPGSLALPQAAVQVDEKKVYVQLINQTSHTIVIPKHQKIAEVHQASVVSDEFSHEVLGDTASTPEPRKNIPVDLDEELLTSEQRDMVQNVLQEWSDVFAFSSTELGNAKGTKHHINLSDETPFKDRARRIPPAMYEEVKNHLADMLACGSIRHSNSP